MPQTVELQNRKYKSFWKDGYMYYYGKQTRMTKQGPRTYRNIAKYKRPAKLGRRGPDKKPRKKRIKPPQDNPKAKKNHGIYKLIKQSKPSQPSPITKPLDV